MGIGGGYLRRMAVLLAFAAPLAAGESAALAGSLQVTVTPTFRGAAVQMGDQRHRHGIDEDLRFERLAGLFSSLALETADGRLLRLPVAAVFWEAGSSHQTFALADVPAGRYQALHFDLGLPPALNHANPGGLAADNPLNPLVNRLHWSWAGGYIFLAIEGKASQSATGSKARQVGFEYHLAEDANRMRYRLPLAVTVATDPSPAVPIELRFELSPVLDAMAPRFFGAGARNTTHSRVDDPRLEAFKSGLLTAFAAAPAGSLAAAAPARPPQLPAERPRGTRAYTLAWPAGFPAPQLPADNPLTEEGVALGAKLFFDPRLSSNRRQSCASCHQPQAALADPGRAVSLGTHGQAGLRNTMPLVNLAWNASYAWDGKRSRLRDQALAPFADPREFNEPAERVAARLARHPAYRRGFRQAFGSDGVTAERLALALEQFLLTRVSADSKFDRVARGDAQFTAQEQRGFQLFATEYDPVRGQRGADCFHCHGGALFSSFDFRNNGLDADGLAKDSGRATVTGRTADTAKFKTPSLRNAALTAPYMHDGRLPTLRAVIDHYADGVQASATLDSNLAKHPELRLELSDADREALVAFLNTLTETALLMPPGKPQAAGRNPKR